MLSALLASLYCTSPCDADQTYIALYPVTQTNIIIVTPND